MRSGPAEDRRLRTLVIGRSPSADVGSPTRRRPRITPSRDHRRRAPVPDRLRHRRRHMARAKASPPRMAAGPPELRAPRSAAAAGRYQCTAERPAASEPRRADGHRQAPGWEGAWQRRVRPVARDPTTGEIVRRETPEPCCTFPRSVALARGRGAALWRTYSRPLIVLACLAGAALIIPADRPLLPASWAVTLLDRTWSTYPLTAEPHLARASGSVSAN